MVTWLYEMPNWYLDRQTILQFIVPCFKFLWMFFNFILFMWIGKSVYSLLKFVKGWVIIKVPKSNIILKIHGAIFIHSQPLFNQFGRIWKNVVMVQNDSSPFWSFLVQIDCLLWGTDIVHYFFLIPSHTSSSQTNSPLRSIWRF